MLCIVITVISILWSDINVLLIFSIKLELIELYCSIGDYNSTTIYIIECIQLATEYSLELEKSVCQMFAAYIQVS